MREASRIGGAKNVPRMSRSTNYTACTFPLMWRCCMAGPTGPAGISSFHVVVTANFTAQQRLHRGATGYTQVA